MSQEKNNYDGQKSPFETKRIAKFIDHQIPSMIASINRLAAAIETYNEINGASSRRNKDGKNNSHNGFDNINDLKGAVKEDMFAMVMDVGLDTSNGIDNQSVDNVGADDELIIDLVEDDSSAPVQSQDGQAVSEVNESEIEIIETDELPLENDDINIEDEPVH